MSGPRILAIESSCDETGVAVVVGGRRIEANQVASQVALHAATGGIVPEVAARQQLRWIVPTLEAALEQSGAGWDDLDAVAVTYGPGLIGSLLVGVNVAKALAVSARPAARRRQPHRGPHLRELALRGRRGRGLAAAAGAAVPAALPGRERRAHAAGAHARSRALHAARPDRGRRGGRGVRQGRSPARAAVSGRPGDQRGRAQGATPATRFPRARTAGAYDFSFSGLKTAVLREVEGYRDAGRADPGRRHRGGVRGGGGRRAGHQDASPRPATTAWRPWPWVAAWPPTMRCAETLDARLRGRGPAAAGAAAAWCTDNGAMIGAAAGFRFAAGDRADAALEAIPNLALPWLAA